MKLDSNSRLYPKILFAGNEEIEPTSTFDLFTQKIEETQSTNIHPMDIFIFLFIRSHPIFRQTLIAQISKCQLSIPLITGPSPTLYTFALRTLYKDCRSVDSVSSSYSVVNEKLPIVSFLRIGECPRSRKSQILNQIIGIQNYFFHRDQMGSSKTRYFLNGTVEIGWLFPQTHEHMKYNGTPLYTILNLRGDALSYVKQRQFLASVSTLIYIFIPCNQINLVYDDVTTFHEEFGTKSVYLLYKGDVSQTQPTQDENRIPNFLSKLSDTVLYRQDNLAEVSNTIISNIVKRMQVTEYMNLSLNDTVPIARRLHLPVDIDSHNIVFCDSVVENIMNTFYNSLSPNQTDTNDTNDTNEMCLAELKRMLLPLQNKGWVKWAETKRAANKFDVEKSNNYSDFKRTIVTSMEEARSEQIHQLENPSKLLTRVITHCRSYGTLYEEFYIIWAMLQHEFNALCKKYLPPLYEEYKRWHKLSCSAESEAESPDDSLRKKYKNSLPHAGWQKHSRILYRNRTYIS